MSSGPPSPAQPSPPPPSRPTGFFDQLRYLAWWQLVLVAAPLSLVGIGGLIGGVLGAAAALGNVYVARSAMSTTTKVLVMLGLLVAAYVVWLVVALAFNALVRSTAG